MRITFLLTQSLESPSGLGRYWPLSTQLARLGHQVVILALHHDLPSLQEHHYVRDGVTVRYVGQMHVRKAESRKYYFSPARLLLVSMQATWQLWRAAISVPCDVYHLGKPHPMNGLAVLGAHLLRRKPVYLDCDDYEAASNRFAGRWQQQTVSWFEERLPRLATGITVNTRFMAQKLANGGYLPSRIVYVPNGVDRERFAATAVSVIERLRHSLDLDGMKTVLYAGSLSLTSHAVDLLLEAFVTVSQREPGAVLVIVGGGEDYENLQQQASSLGIGSRVRFTGHVAAERMPAFYAMADVTVDPVNDDLASRARSPLKVVESLAAGTPVVTEDVGDRREMLSGGGGLLVAPGHPASLAEGLLAVLQDDRLRASLASQAPAASEHNYWDELVQQFVRVYDL